MSTAVYYPMMSLTTLRELYDQTGRVDFSAIARKLDEPTGRFALLTGLTANALRQNPTSERAQPQGRRLVRLLEHLNNSFGDWKDTMIWMRHAHPELEGRSPLEVIEAGLIEAIEGLANDLATGQPG